MSTTLEELKVVIEGEIAPFQKKMREMENQLRRSQSKVQSSVAGMKNAIQNKTSSMASMLGRLGKLAVFSILAKKMLDVGMYSTQMALEVTAAINQINRQMGESSQAFLKWAERNANAMNMSVGEATKYGAVYSNLFSNFIKDSNKLSAYTAKMLQTSAVIAEGSGRSITDVMERIRSGLLGNTEAIEDLGINVNVAMIESTNAFKRFAGGQHWKDLDYNTQQQIRLMAILEQASAKYGDTLQQSVNGRISLFKSLLKDAALNVGNAMLPIINAMMPVLNSFAMVLKNVTAKLAEFVGLMFNKKAKVKQGAVAEGMKGIANNAGQAGDAVGDLADGLGAADDASGGMADNLADGAKQAKKAVKELLGLAGFDEITSLKIDKGDDSADDPNKGKSPGRGGGGKGKGKGGGSGQTDILPEIGLEDMDNQFKSIFDGLGDKLKPLLDYLAKLWDFFKKGFDLTFRYDSIDRLKKALAGIWKSFKEIFEDGTVLQAAARFGERLAFALGQVVGAIANVIFGIAVFIAESLNKSLNETKLDIKAWLIRQFDIAGDIVASIGNIAQRVSQIFYDTITSVPATDIGSHIISGLTYGFMGVSDFINKYVRDAFAGLDLILKDNQDKITQAFIGLLQALEPIVRSIKGLIKNTFSGIGAVYDEHLKPYFDSLHEGWSKIWGTFIDSWNTYIQPVLENVGNGLSDLMDNHLQPFIDSFLEFVGKVIDATKDLWEGVIQPFFDWLAANILPVVAPIFQVLADIFVIGWRIVIDTLKAVFDILNGLIDFVKGVMTGDWQLAWEDIKQIVQAFVDVIVSLFKGMWDVIVSLFTNAWNLIVALAKGAWDAIVGIFSGMGSWFGARWQDTVNALSNIGSWFREMFQKAWTGLTSIFSRLGSWFGEQWGNVKNALSSVVSWFGQIFSQAYNAVTNAFSSIGTFFSGVWSTVKGIFVNAGQQVGSAVGGAFRSAVNAVLGTIENVVNGFISMINGVIGIINKLPGVSLGGIGYISLPRLARGGIVDSPTVAMIGEAGKEVVMPLENTGFLQTMGRVVGGAVVNALGGGVSQTSGLPTGDIVIVIGSKEFGRFSIDAINQAQADAGELLLNI